MGGTLEQDVEEIKKSLDSIKDTLDMVSIVQEQDHIMTLEHDKILIRGNGVPSLQDTVRTLVKSTNELISDFKIAQKLQLDRDASGVRTCWVEQQNMTNLTKIVNDWVEDVKEERKRRNKQEEAEKARKRAEANKWKWAAISLGFAIVPPTVWQIIIFWVKIVDPALIK